MSSGNTIQCPPFRQVAAALVAGCLLCLCGCATNSPDYDNQRAFHNPEEAVSTLIAAAKAGDIAGMEAIFGAGAREVLSSGDPVADRNNREIFAAAAAQSWSVQRVDGNTKELIIGHEQWPFPVPLEKDRRGWWFNTAAGKQEVLARRIGRNELAAIGALQAYVLAQREYAATGHDGKPAGLFAQKVRSDPGMHNGLYWPGGAGEDRSPLGEFAAAAVTEGYGTQPKELAAPYHGYYYRILTEQGPDAPGGAGSFLVHGEMTAGFAMLAFPAEYGNSGIMTFLVAQDGVIYEGDLGADTPRTAGAMTRYNPDQRWRRID